MSYRLLDNEITMNLRDGVWQCNDAPRFPGCSELNECTLDLCCIVNTGSSNFHLERGG